jgi:hypothetical protein
VLLDDVAADDAAGADAAVVRALRRRGSRRLREAERRAVGRSIVYSCSMPNQVSSAWRTSWRPSASPHGCWWGAASCVGEQHLAEHEDVAPPRIGSGQGTRACSTQSTCSPVGLVGRRAVEAPDRGRRPRRRPGSWSCCGGGRRLGAVEPDVLGLVCHDGSFQGMMTGSRGGRARRACRSGRRRAAARSTGRPRSTSRGRAGRPRRCVGRASPRHRADGTDVRGR